MTKNRLFQLAALVASAALCTSCNESDPTPPKVGHLELFVIENALTGSPVGTITSNTPGANFTIDDTGSPFAIDLKTGDITVRDSAAIDFERHTSFIVPITVSDPGNKLFTQDTVTIHVTNQSVPAPQLYANYIFEDNVIDQQMHSHGIPEDIAYVLARRQKAGLFNGTTAAVKIPDPFDFPWRTVSIWLKVAGATTGNDNIIYSTDNADLLHNLYILSVTYEGSQLKLTYNVSNVMHTVNIQKDTWYNATFSQHYKDYSLYLDGKLLTQQTIADYEHSSNGYAGATLGVSRTGDRHFNGQLDNVRIYIRGLTRREVELLYYED